MKKYIRSFFLLIPMGFLFLSSCYRDDDKPENPPPPGNGSELITSLILHFTDTADTSITFDFSFRDVDGEGGAAPVEWDTISLNAGRTYRVQLELLDESYPIHIMNISDEVHAEAEDHFFCFESTGTPLTITRTDTDGTYEVGLESLWLTDEAPGTGTVTITLRHQPGIKDGTCLPGDTDVQVTFELQVL